MYRLTLAAAFTALALPAAAQGFSLSEATLYEGWPMIEIPEQQAGGDYTEYKVYAIVDDSHGVETKTYYMVLSASSRSQHIVGAMECSSQFQVLTSGGNGARDLLCSNSWGTTVYIMGADGEYRAQ